MSYLIDMGWAPTMRTIGQGRHVAYLRQAESRIASSLPEGYAVRCDVRTIRHDHLARIIITRPDGSSDLIEFSVDRLGAGKAFSDLGARLSSSGMAAVGQGSGHIAVHHSRSGHNFGDGPHLPPTWSELVTGHDNLGAICIGAQGGERVRWAMVLSDQGPSRLSIYLSDNGRSRVKWFASSGQLVKGSEDVASMVVLFPPSRLRIKPKDVSFMLAGAPHGLVIRDPHGGQDLDSEDSLEIALEAGGHIVEALDPSFSRSIGPEGSGESTVYRSGSSRLVKLGALLALPWAGKAPPPFYGWPTPRSGGS